MRMTWHSHSFTFPAVTEPEWSAQVERWYQLDAPSFGVTELYWRNRQILEQPPAWIFLCSPGASNATDQQFAQTTAPSPAKFVHTLPNIRSAALLQVMKWSGPVLCLQKDPNTILTGLHEALLMATDGAGPAWVVSVTRETQSLTSHIFVLGENGPLKIVQSTTRTMGKTVSHDKQLLSWLNKIDRSAFKGSDLWIE